MKFYYFDVYGRGEPIRMALWKAGVQYEDVRLGGPTWQEFKNSGKAPFGQMPLLELDDGTILGQSFAILNYVGLTHGLKPNDALKIYKGESLSHFIVDDYFVKEYAKAAWSPNADELVQDAILVKLPPVLETLAKQLPDGKFITGDQLSIYDFTIGGWFTNLVLNPNAKYKAHFDVVWANAPEKVKTYVNNFVAEMKPYLDSRVQTSTM